MSLDMKLEGRSFSAKLRRLSPEVRQRMIPVLNTLTFALAEEAKKKFDEAGLHNRSAALKGSIHAEGVTESAHELVGRVVAGQKLKYAKLQEFGGTIKAKNVQFLTIPLAAALTPAGVLRFTAPQIESAGYVGSFVHNGVLFGILSKTKDGKDIVPLFALKRSVTVPARAFMQPALQAMQPKITGDIHQVLDNGVR